MGQLDTGHTSGFVKMAHIGVDIAIIATHWAFFIRTNQFIAHGILGSTILETDHCDQFVASQGETAKRMLKIDWN